MKTPGFSIKSNRRPIPPLYRSLVHYCVWVIQTCTVGLAACSGGEAVGQSLHRARDAAPDSSAAARCGDTPVRLVDYMQDLPDAQVGVTAPLIGVNDAALFYLFTWRASLGTPEGPRGYLVRVPLQGGEPVRLAVVWDSDTGPQAGPQRLVVTQGAAIFSQARGSEAGSDAIVSVPAEGGEPTTIATTSGFAYALVADDRNVYFADDEGTKSVPLAGGAVQTLTALRGYSLAVGGGTLYLGAVDGQAGGVSSVPTEGGPVTVLATAPKGAHYLVLCGDNLCWIEVLGIYEESLKQLVPGGTPTVLYNGFSETSSLLFDGKNFFIAAGFGGLARIPAAGGTPVSINSEAMRLALDDSCLYWSALSGIYSLARSAADTAPDIRP